MCRLLVSILVWCSGPTLALADTTEDSTQKMVAIKDLMTVSHMENDCRLGASQIIREVEKRISQASKDLFALDKKLSPQQREQKSTALTGFVMDRFKQLLSQELDLEHEIEMTAMMEVDKNFSLSDLHSMIAFYETPTGKKSLAVAEPMQADVSALLDARFGSRISTLVNKALEERINQLIKKTMDETSALTDKGKAKQKLAPAAHSRASTPRTR